MADLKNNLFNYATKELSQDAFICWLCSYALEDADKSDTELVKCAETLVYEFMKRGIGEIADPNEVKLRMVEKQKGNIDVLLTVDYLGKTYKIIVEDKIHASEHDNQLERYKKQIANEGIEVIGIYYKTGFQSDLSVVNAAGYKVFNRRDVIELLGTCNSNNAILKDYKAYWENFEELAQSYKKLSLDKWGDWQPVNGFYDEMQSALEKEGLWAGYDYVSNRSGGFWGLWYGIDNDTIEINGQTKAVLYLQIEASWNDAASRYDYRICSKLENTTGNKGDEDIAKLKRRIVNIQETYGFSRPSYLRSGTYMTVGLFSDIDLSLSYEEFRGTILESVRQYKLLIQRLKDDSDKSEM
ncbi:PD-(D/E)XK nuclease superfamily protein [Lachnospiraceae bacterium XBB2008]|nr:PD-(D/E)XK nuclease superfamily protein [Lachnospiraceae bacterium XBB2008]